MNKVLVLATMAAALASCGKADLNEACDTAGSTDECKDGLVCTNFTSNGASGNSCFKQCTDQTDCTSTQSCNGVSGTNIKSCQPN